MTEAAAPTAPVTPASAAAAAAPSAGIGQATIDASAEGVTTPVAGVSGKKESEVFAASVNQHELAILKQEMGFLGGFFGASTTGPTNIGGLALVLVVLFVGTSFFFTNTAELNEARKWAYTLGTGALGFLFGAAKNKD